MKIVAASLHPYELALRSEWRSAAGNITKRRGWRLELTTDGNRCGWGECAPLPSHGTEDFTAAEAALLDWQKMLPGRRLGELLRALASPVNARAPATRAAVECAVLDLLAQAAGQPLDVFLGARHTSRNIGCNAIAGSLNALVIEPGVTCVKLKLGLDTPDDELAALHSLATTLPTGVRLRLDANRAWDTDTAARMLHSLTDLPIDAVEEPMQTPDIDTLRALQRELPYPLALDESLAGLDRRALLESPPVRRLVLKLAPLGGVLPALDLARQARTAGVECVVTTGIDSACGTLAAAHLASALGNGLAHGLATGAWLQETMGRMPGISGGMLTLPDGNGLGYSIIESTS